MNFTSNRLLINIFIAIFIIFSFIFVKGIYQHQFGGYDLSILIDMAYRLQHGEKPGVNFISTYPISLVYWIKLSLLFFKNNWNLLFYSGYVHFLFCVAAIYAALYNNVLFKRWAIIPILIVLAVPLMVTNHIWPSYFSEYTALVLYIPISIIILTGKVRTVDYLILFLFTGLSLFTKQNVGLLTTFLYGVIIGICYFTNQLSKESFFKVIAIAFGSAVLYLLSIYLFLGMNTDGIIKTYTAVLGRGLPTKGQILEVFIWNENFWISLAMFIFGVFTLVPLFSVLKSAETDKKLKIFIWFNVFVQVIGYYSVLTNWDTKLNDFALIAVSNLCVLLVIKRRVLTYSYMAFITLIFIYSVNLGQTRYRMRNVGVGSFYETQANYQIKNSYLNGVYCGKILYEVNNELVAMKESGFLTNRVFFGPRIEFSYAQYELPSPQGMPLWWHPGSSYGMKDEKNIIELFKKLNFQTLVFLKNDRTRVPNEILEYIDAHYYVSKPSAYLDIYSKK